MKLIVYTDGGARGNPGPAAAGVVLCSNVGAPLKKYSEYLGQATNNIAEYSAIILALKKIKALYDKDKIKKMEIEIRSDSELAIKQLNHQYKIENKELQPLFLKIWNMMIDFGVIKFVHISRKENEESDRLVNECLDNQGKEMILPGF
jgi:ribonuclease HI